MADTVKFVSEPELIDTAELAAMLAVSAKTVRRLVDSGRVPGVVRIGRLLRFRRAAVRQWIESSCLPPPARRAGR